MEVHAVGNLNSSDAARVLGECHADLGIVLGTRILKPSTFRVPRLGCINLHKGKVPEYRGMPPGFWELYDGASSAGITVHFVDAGLDTGDVIATGSVPIHKFETPESLLEKLHVEGSRVLASAVTLIRDGKAVPLPQQNWAGKPRSTPTRQELRSLKCRLPHWQPKDDLPIIARNLFHLAVYYSGLYFVVRRWHRMAKSRATIFLHHRVNDYANDVLTVDTETFAAQLLAISKRYPFATTAEIVSRLRANQPLQPTTVAIHFDDCYRDIFTHGAPLLKTLGLPACAFINSGYVDTQRTFPHDASRYPFTFSMLSSSELQTWSSMGFEVGAHTVNHVDLGITPTAEAESEIVLCGKELQRLLCKPVELFSFPFGRPENINTAARHIVETSGYRALFSAHGGHITHRTDLYAIPREGASYESSPLYCLLQIEGLTLNQLAAKLGLL